MVVVVEVTARRGFRVRAAAAAAVAVELECGVLVAGTTRTQPPLRSCKRRRHFAVTPTSVKGSRMFSSIPLLAVVVVVVDVVVVVCFKRFFFPGRVVRRASETNGKHRGRRKGRRRGRR